VYFANPYSPWERGLNENTNGLIRQFFPKGTDFNNILEDEVLHVQHLINSRPRKTLGYKTPYEVLASGIN
ncbi:MAG TPA: IS30 family transposase, partial [Victivallales bacterium]|nr:IS30 family transposase [Victivallales bacterium]